MPIRIQRKRTKGWKAPAGAVYVGRPTKFGNPWTVDGYWDAGYAGDITVARQACVEEFRAWMTRTPSNWSGSIPDLFNRQPPDVSELRGKDLMCWCPLDQPCHAYVLLKLANQEEHKQ